MTNSMTPTFATGLFHDGVGQASFEGGDGAAVGLTTPDRFSDS